MADPTPLSLINAFDALAPSDQQKVVAASVDKLDDAQKSVAVAAAAQTLPDSAKKDLVDALKATLPPPSADTNNWIWIMIIGAFVFVFVGTAGAMSYSLLSDHADAFDKFLIIFTSVVGFLAGLISPSPVKKSA